MKKIFLLAILLLGATTIFAQDTLTTSHYTTNGKRFAKLPVEKHFVLNKVSPERTEFTILNGKTVEMQGYMTKCEVVRTEVVNNTTVTTRHLVIVDKQDNKTKYEYLLTIIVVTTTNQPIKFLVTAVHEKTSYRTYLGKIF